MVKHTDDHLTQLPRIDGTKPFEALEYLAPGSNTGPDLDAPEPAQAADPMAQRFFNLSQAGKIFGKTPRTMRWWADTGRVRTIKIGASRFITEAEIQRLLTGGEG
jgi:hypothetical protein